MNTEKVILSSLVSNDEYGRKVIPFLSLDYFHNNNEKIVFKLIDEYVNKYNAFPSKEALIVDLGNKPVSQETFDECNAIIGEITTPNDLNKSVDWLVDTTEKFCQDKAIYNAIMESIQILDDKSEKKQTKGSIPIVESLVLNSISTSSIRSLMVDCLTRR